MLTFNFKKILVTLLIIFFLFSSTFNIIYSLITFVATNLSVRESFYFKNDKNLKGTHSGGKLYVKTTKNYKIDIIQFNFQKLFNSFLSLSQIHIDNTNFKNEYQFINLLKIINKNDNKYKRSTAIYIPKNLDVYWNLSCDTHMIPFVIPAITNIAMIDGLPYKKKSCYNHFLDYGYNTYYIRNKSQRKKITENNMICIIGKNKGFKRIIEINYNVTTKFQIIEHLC